jgi:hypothetical protein
MFLNEAIQNLLAQFQLRAVLGERRYFDFSLALFVQVDENSFINLLLKFFSEFLHFGNALNAQANLLKGNKVSNWSDLVDFVFEGLDCAAVFWVFEIFVPQVDLHAEVINIVESYKGRVRDFELLANATYIEELALKHHAEIQDSSTGQNDAFRLVMPIGVLALVSIGPLSVIRAALLGLFRRFIRGQFCKLCGLIFEL